MNSELNGIRHRRQLALHAIGDGAIRQFLDALDTFKSESTLNPLELIHLAVNRSNGEAVTPLEALTAYTKGSAYAEFMESEKGTLSAGKLADCVVLSENPTHCSPDKIKDIQVVMTITGGRIVFRNDLETGHD